MTDTLAPVRHHVRTECKFSHFHTLLVCMATAFGSFTPDSAWAGQPSGEGDPTETRCMPGEHITGTLFQTPAICKTNAQWAQLKKDHVVLKADGTARTKDPRDIGAHVCVRTNMVVTGTSEKDIQVTSNYQCN